MLITFDLDGVLIDSKANMAFSWAACQEVFGLDKSKYPFDAYFQHIGRPFQQILQIMGLPEERSQLCLQKIEEVYFSVSQENQHLVQLYPEVCETLESLASIGHQLCVVTSKSEGSTLRILSRFGILDFFSKVMCPDSIEARGLRGKPHPDHLLHCMNDVGYMQNSAIYVGDMSTDQQCAKAANVPFIFASWGYGAVDSPEYTLISMSDLLRICVP
jgi:HAD superfamily hydrolase (TIGR01549 family)